jgi:glycosyltransferase involved in cell wall biosynthesis
MKIGMLVDTYLPILGGAEVHVLELSRALRQQGYEITVCTAVPDKEAMAANREAFTLTPIPSPKSGGGVKMEEPFSPDRAANEVGEEFSTLRLPMLVGGGWRAALGIPLALPRLVAFIRQADFIHCHYSFLLAALGTFLGRLLGKPTAVTLHGLGTLDSSVGRSVLWRLYRFISLRLADTVIATSEEMKSVALRFTSAEKIVVIPNGVDSRRFSPASKPASPVGEVVILSMRRLAPKNGVQYLVEAAPEVLAAAPGVCFWVTGEGKLEGHIRRRVSELGLEKHFRFLGMVPHDQTPDVYRQADIVVFPSSAESTSLACLEAMCMEKAIIASGLSAYKEMLGASGERGLLVSLFDREDSDYNAPLYLPAERIHELAQAIISLAGDSGLRLRLGHAARSFAAGRYDWGAIAEQTKHIYQTGST